MPPARPGQPQPRRLDRAAARLRALLPAAGAAGAALLVVAAVAGAFAAGRLTRTTPSAPAAATTSTVPGFLDEGPETGRRQLNWQARAGALRVTLRAIVVGTGFSRLELHIDGVPRGREVSALERLRIRDAAGNDLLPGGQVASIPTAASRPAPGGGIDAEVVLGHAVDQRAVAAVEVGGLTVARYVQERLRGSLTDPGLRRRAHDSLDDGHWLATRSGCPGCRLRVTCQDCRGVRLAGSAYRRGRIILVVEALDRVERTVLNTSRRRVTFMDPDGIRELPAWIDGAGRLAVISAWADELALTHLDRGDGDGDPMPFELVLDGQAEQAVRGPWTIRQPGSP